MRIAVAIIVGHITSGREGSSLQDRRSSRRDGASIPAPLQRSQMPEPRRVRCYPKVLRFRSVESEDIDLQARGMTASVIRFKCQGGASTKLRRAGTLPPAIQ